MASETFDSMPPVDPVTWEQDGFPDIELSDDSVILKLGDQTIVLPGHGIEKHSLSVLVGGNYDLNRVQLTLFAGRIEAHDNRDDIRVIRTDAVPGDRSQLPNAQLTREIGETC